VGIARHTSTLCGSCAGFFNVKADGAYCYQCALKGEIVSVSHRNPLKYPTIHTVCLIKVRLYFVSWNCPPTVFKFMLYRSPELVPRPMWYTELYTAVPVCVSVNVTS
jgi:hypothetical protein